MINRRYPAEFVFPGHPDKLSDAIADALVEEAWRRDPRALVGVEVAVHRDHVYITGRIGCPEAAAIKVTSLVQTYTDLQAILMGGIPRQSRSRLFQTCASDRLKRVKLNFVNSLMIRPFVWGTRMHWKPRIICPLSNG